MTELGKVRREGFTDNALRCFGNRLRQLGMAPSADEFEGLLREVIGSPLASPDARAAVDPDAGDVLYAARSRLIGALTPLDLERLNMLTPDVREVVRASSLAQVLLWVDGARGLSRPRPVVGAQG